MLTTEGAAKVSGGGGGGGGGVDGRLVYRRRDREQGCVEARRRNRGVLENEGGTGVCWSKKEEQGCVLPAN